MYIGFNQIQSTPPIIEAKIEKNFSNQEINNYLKNTRGVVITLNEMSSVRLCHFQKENSDPWTTFAEWYEIPKDLHTKWIKELFESPKKRATQNAANIAREIF